MSGCSVCMRAAAMLCVLSVSDVRDTGLFLHLHVDVWVTERVDSSGCSNVRREPNGCGCLGLGGITSLSKLSIRRVPRPAQHQLYTVGRGITVQLLLFPSNCMLLLRLPSLYSLVQAAPTWRRPIRTCLLPWLAFPVTVHDNLDFLSNPVSTASLVLISAVVFGRRSFAFANIVIPPIAIVAFALVFPPCSFDGAILRVHHRSLLNLNLLDTVRRLSLVTCMLS